MYAEVVDDPKIQRLSGDQIKFWVNCLCLSAGNNGYLPSIADICWKLRLSEAEVTGRIASLYELKLLDQEGDTFAPHNWNARQYRSDDSKDRVKKHRDKKQPVTPTAPTPVTVTMDDFAPTPVTVTATPSDGNAPRTEQNRAEQRQSREADDAPTPAPKSAATPDYQLRYEALYSKHPWPGKKQDGLFRYLAIIQESVHPERVADAIDKSQAEYIAFWAASPGEYVPSIDKWFEDEYYLRKPVGKQRANQQAPQRPLREYRKPEPIPEDDAHA